MNEVRISTEDTKVVASRVNARWFVTVQDLLGPEKQECQMSDEEFAAVVALAIGGDEQKAAELLYEIAEPQMEKWKLVGGLRIIP